MSSIPSRNWKVFTLSHMQETEKFVSYRDYFHTVQIQLPNKFNVTKKYDENYEEIF